jgi:hypothetical protein
MNTLSARAFILSNNKLDSKQKKLDSIRCIVYSEKQTSIQKLKKNRLINKVMDKKVMFAVLLLGAVGYGSYRYYESTKSLTITVAKDSKKGLKVDVKKVDKK